MLGQAFRKGDVPAGTELRLTESTGRVVVKRRWNDGSVKHAVIVGRTDLTANTPKSIGILAGTPTTGINLTATDIQGAAPAAFVQCGSIGTVNLSGLLSAPFRTWISTPEMVECHYRSAVGNDPNLVVWFHVRLWAGGRVWVRAIVENGYLNQSPGTKSFTATVAIGGSNVVNAQAITQYQFTRWTAEGWIGGDPAITPSHNVAYLISTRLVPNYWKRSPSLATLSALRQTYAPMQLSPQPVAMSGTGFGYFMGVLPNWSALYVTSGDVRAYRATITASSAFNTYSVCRRDSGTNRVLRPSQHPTTTFLGVGAGGQFSIGNAAGEWENAHLPNEGYVAYLCTGDYWHYETMAFNASACYLSVSSSAGSGVNRVLYAQTRATGWMLNVLGHFCAIAPTEGEAASDTAVVTDYQALLASNATAFYNASQLPGQNQLGTPYQYGLGEWAGVGSVAPWMNDFWVAANGQISNMDPLTNLTSLNGLRDYMYRWVVGRLGPTGADNYHFSRAGNQYGIVIASSDTSDETQFFDSWGQVWAATFGGANAETTNTLQGAGGSGDPAEAATNQRWGPVLTAMAYAVEHNATGAAAAWARFTGASNWSALENGSGAPANFHDTPLWGIVPRGFGGT